MTDKLPPQLLALFTARPTLKWLAPLDHALEERKTAKIDGIASFMTELQAEPAPYQATESWLQRKDRIKAEKAERQKKLLSTDFAEQYNPKDDKNIRGSGYETLFVGRLSYNTTKEELQRHFERFGPIERVRIVAGSGVDDKKHAGKSRGYAFIQFSDERDMKGKADL